ncbi:transcriptional regulator, HxlR family [Amycolatopsis marina]|uniref:Transcriptional regulator, HxlR family n=1 Tax=Amycolatopsis marina TaxID=490629 RepID=A0A1I0Y3S3_9PSEU|nr:winged helix-turn-helix transcriptional regulator [Amycolatopsis marina]SFB07250.1 transcriptional regulator, HxlR family [Amycolatopsis marina]
MATSRSYNDACGMAHALDLVGERWALLVVRELVLGPKRYTDLRVGLPGISANVLSHRLDELTETGVVRRRRLGPPSGASVYELTEWGQELEPVIMRLGRWGARSPSRPREANLSVSSVVLSLRTNFEPAASADIGVGLELRFGEEHFLAKVDQGKFEVHRAPGNHDQAPDAVVDTTPIILAGLLYGGQDLDAAVDSGSVTVEGDRAVVERFLTLFPLPVPAAGWTEQTSR